MGVMGVYGYLWLSSVFMGVYESLDVYGSMNAMGVYGYPYVFMGFWVSMGAYGCLWVSTSVN